MKNIFLALLCGIALLFATGLTSCSDETNAPMQQAPNASKAAVKKGSMEKSDKPGEVVLKDDEGKKMGIAYTYSSDKLADNFPKDIPIYTAAKIKMSQVWGGANAVATLTTKDSPETVLKFYKTALPQNGWTIKDEVASNNIIIFRGEKARNSVSFQISKQGEETGITFAMEELEK